MQVWQDLNTVEQLELNAYVIQTIWGRLVQLFMYQHLQITNILIWWRNNGQIRYFQKPRIGSQSWTSLTIMMLHLCTTLLWFHWPSKLWIITVYNGTVQKDAVCLVKVCIQNYPTTVCLRAVPHNPTNFIPYTANIQQPESLSAQPC